VSCNCCTSVAAPRGRELLGAFPSLPVPSFDSPELHRLTTCLINRSANSSHISPPVADFRHTPNDRTLARSATVGALQVPCSARQVSKNDWAGDNTLSCR